MKKLLDIQKANLFKEAFALAIKKQQDLIVEKEKEIQIKNSVSDFAEYYTPNHEVV